MQRSVSLLAALFALAVAAHADVRLPAVLGEHMVLQRNVALPIWGWASAGEAVSVSFAGQQQDTLADANGTWRVTLDPVPAGGPHELRVTGDNELRVRDVLVGEVWLCSGQSNMEWELALSENAARHVSEATHPQLRLFHVPRGSAAWPRDDTPSEWRACTPASAEWFSAVAYFFGRRLHAELGVPVGLVASAFGGTHIEPWTPPEGFAAIASRQVVLDEMRMERAAYPEALRPRLDAYETWVLAARAALADGSPLPDMPEIPDHPHAARDQPSALYNVMIHPLVPFAFGGVTWYQGEQDLGDGALYTEKMRAWIAGWREVFERPELPVLFVQLAPFEYSSGFGLLAELREAQRAASAIPGTAMALTPDVGDLHDIHPKDKLSVGERLARLALHHVFGRSELIANGPLVSGLERLDDGRVRVRFRWSEGLRVTDEAAPGPFELRDAQDNWVPAEARLDGETIVLAAAGVASPRAVRFAWDASVPPNLVNAASLPACPFREDLDAAATAPRDERAGARR
ncbi:MAG: hypothetical protein DHS20C15_26910 [Planctomycetota bacterium]|nr:MAG: hypothetical protein DHS20C15_26910 [Planctomycetota bacterium]